MQKVSIFAACGLCLLMATACVTYYRADYDIRLARVERPADARERYGETSIELVSEGIARKYSFEDQMVSIVWLPTPYQFYFELKNKTDHSLKIIWDEAIYVDVNGEKLRLMHPGRPLSERDSPQKPTVVAQGTIVFDAVFPTSNILNVSGDDSGWRLRPMFPVSSRTQSEVLGWAERFPGEVVQVLLPFEIEGVTNEYIFIFNVRGVNTFKSTTAGSPR